MTRKIKAEQAEQLDALLEDKAMLTILETVRKHLRKRQAEGRYNTQESFQASLECDRLLGEALLQTREM